MDTTPPKLSAPSEENPKLSAEIETTVEFFDLDPMNVVWHGNYVKFFEAARCKFLDEIGFNYAQMAEEKLAFPVVKMAVKYVHPCRFRQRLRVVAELADEDINFLRFKFKIFDATSGVLMTNAEISQAGIDLSTGETLFSLPEILREKIAAAKAQKRGAGTKS